MEIVWVVVAVATYSAGWHAFYHGLQREIRCRWLAGFVALFWPVMLSLYLAACVLVCWPRTILLHVERWWRDRHAVRPELPKENVYR